MTVRHGYPSSRRVIASNATSATYSTGYGLHGAIDGNFAATPKAMYFQRVSRRMPGVLFSVLRSRNTTPLGNESLEAPHENPCPWYRHRSIAIRINWPGYKPVTTLLQIKSGERVTRAYLGYRIAHFYQAFIEAQCPHIQFPGHRPQRVYIQDLALISCTNTINNIWDVEVSYQPQPPQAYTRRC